MMNKPIYAFGELLIDFLQVGQTVSGALALPVFNQFPGGAPANAAVAAAKLGAESYMIGQVGDDQFGRFCRDALEKYSVNTEYLKTTDQGKTPLAFVSLDDQGERSFEFYRDRSADLLIELGDLPKAEDLRPGIIHVCSNTLTDSHIAAVHLEWIEQLSHSGKFTVSFDVNLRKNLWPEGSNYKAPILKMLQLANIIKISREELDEIFSVNADTALTEHCFDGNAEAIYITDGGHRLKAVSRFASVEIQPPSVNVVDTTAAGDAFSGGLLYQASMGVTDCSAVAGFATRCGAYAVQHAGAFTSLPSMADI
ncbi:carbohydrate kinase family protein [Reinekea marinisedimentorum]|uniref:Fructokinase n=1 Tax=Reinekea marinisedimentorum TaxID=230495 RepID=A0A4R3I3R4_9GAMM|nr:carbohydrate kinase [Reinekea marinisedimentorum]TCS40356.1 fructokinase [Reinekea marinisedimentorum]